MTDEVLFEIDGSVAVITINRPDKRNALNRTVRAGLYDAWDRFERDPELRVAVLTGAGKVFCAGADLAEMADAQLTVVPRDYFPVLGQNVRVTKPTIAAVNGAALAGGWMMAQMCDLCVAADDAVFGITEIIRGRGAPWASPLIHMLPQRLMMEVLLTGTPMSAKRLFEAGFINRLVPGDKLLGSALELAHLIGKGAPLSVQACKEMVMLSTEMGRTPALETSIHIFDRVYRSEDAREGPRAFVEKRAPVWKGR